MLHAATKGERDECRRESPAVITQGSTVEEAKENLMSALNLYLEDMREDKDDCDDRDIILTEGLELVP